MDVKETAIKAITSCIPYVGGAIASIIGDYCSDRKEERLMEFLTNFRMEIEDKQEYIVREYIDSPDFLDVFENILRDIMNTRTEVKRNMLRNLLVNSCTIPFTQYDRTEEFQHLIDVLSPTSLMLLSVFYRMRHIRMDGKKEAIKTIWSELRTASNITEDMDSVLLDYIGELENRCLVEAFRNNTYNVDSGTPLIAERPFITEKGISFFRYVTIGDEPISNSSYSNSIPKNQSMRKTVSAKEINTIVEEKLKDRFIFSVDKDEPIELKEGQTVIYYE
jgi:hypothetical protein